MAQWAPWFSVSGGNANPGAPISVVARNPNHLDLFITSTGGVTGTDGFIYTTSWDQSSGWSSEWVNVSGGVAFSGSPISVVARNPNHLDLFITSSDNHIDATWWDESGGQWAPWFNVSSGVTASVSLTRSYVIFL